MIAWYDRMTWIGMTWNDRLTWNGGLTSMVATDEAYFYLTESIKKQNNRMCINERPEDWI